MKLFRLLFLTIIIHQLLISNCSAQWTTNGPYAGDMNCLAVSGVNIYAGTTGNGVFLSTNNGANWSALNNGIPVGSVVYTIAATGNKVFAGTASNVNYFSPDNGAHWKPDTTADHAVSALFVGNDILLGTLSGLFLSTDSGSHWIPETTGLGHRGIYSLAVNGSRIYAGTIDSVFVSTDNANTWAPVSTGLPANYTGTYLATDDSTIFAGTFSGIYVSKNNGAGWSPSGTGLPQFTVVTSLTINGPYVYACTGNGIYLSTNYGATWTLSSLNSVETYQTVVSDTGIFVAAYVLGVFLSTDNGATFTQVNNGLENTDVTSLAAYPSGIFAGTFQDGINISANNGGSWTARFIGLPDSPSVYSSPVVYGFASLGANIFAGTSQGVFVSTDQGSGWVLKDSGFNNLTAIIAKGNDLFAIASSLVYRSADNGNTWNAVDSGIPSGATVFSLGINGITIFAGTDSGVYASVNNGAIWSPANTGLPPDNVLQFTSVGSIIFAGCANAGIYRSDNNGVNWSPSSAGLGNTAINSFITYGTGVFAGTNGGVYQSADSGASWTSLGLTGYQVNALTIGNGYIYAGVNNIGVYQRPVPGVNCNLAPPALTVAHNPICNGDSASICATPGFTSYLWNNADTGQCIYTKQAGNYYPTVTDQNSCTAVGNAVTIRTAPLSQVAIALYGDTLVAVPANFVSYQWYYFGVLIDSATDSFYLPVHCYDFTVQVVDTNGCKAVSPGFDLVCEGVTQPDETNIVNIYPNPSAGSWQLAVGNDLVGAKLEVYDAEGRVVMKDEVRNTKYEITSGSLPAGVYYLLISNDKVSVVRKLVKINQ